MITIILISPCCGKGQGQVNKLLKALATAKIEYGYRSMQFKSQKYITKKEETPAILIEGFGIIMKTEELDKPFVVENLVKTLTPKQEMTTK